MPVSTPNGYLDFTNATPRATKVIATSNVGIGFNNPLHALDVDGSANVGALTATTLSVTNTPLATLAANLVTYDSSTGVFQDSGGLFSNKLSVVSEQPPSALGGASTTVEKHGTYKVTASTGTPQNAFDKATNTSWDGSSSYTGGSGTGVYVGSTTLATGLEQGDWIALELPYKATLRHLTLTAVDAYATSLPYKANLYATNDSLTWTELKYWEAGETTVVVNASAPYKKFALVTTKTAGNGTLKVGQLKLFCESFSVDGGKIEMATSAITGGETVMDQTTGHARESAVLKKYPEVAFTEGEFLYYPDDNSNTFTMGGYTVSGSSSHTTHQQYRAFDGNAETFAHTGTGDSFGGTDNAYDGTNSLGGISGYWHKLQLPYKIKLSRVNLRARFNSEDQAPADFTFIGSNDDTNWTTIQAFTGQAPAASGGFYYDITSNPIPYKYLALVTTKTVGSAACSFAELEYYGYEERNTTGDTSLDTTITSKYNTPDLTNASLYLDGLKGSTATDYSGNELTVTENNVDWDSTEKAWVLSGEATSNLVTADLGWEGDQPHSISAWVKADQIGEDDTLFQLGTEEKSYFTQSIGRIALSSNAHITGWGTQFTNQENAHQPFFSNAAWHNVTYVYGGLGREKKLFVDGKLLKHSVASDTFCAFPHINMNNYWDRGYVAEASSEYSDGTHKAWEAFNDEISNGDYAWISDTNSFNGGGNTYAGSANLGTDSGGTATTTGEWLKVSMPHRIKCAFVRFHDRGGNYTLFPRDGKIYGSNDGVEWDELKSFTGMEVNDASGIFAYQSVNSNKAYNHLAIVITKSNNNSWVGLNDLRFFGTYEHDFVRFPSPGKVLTYPNVDFQSGPCRNGYVVTASSGDNDVYQAHNAIGGYESSDFTMWLSLSVYNAGGGLPTASAPTTSESSNTWAGEWVQLFLPHKIRVSGTSIARHPDATYGTARAPKDGVILGSNDGTTWSYVYHWTGVSSSDYPQYGHKQFTFTTSDYYQYYRLIGTRNQGVANIHNISISDWRLHGEEEDRDVFMRVGGGFDGKIRNLRVFSTDISNDRVREIYDTDKDEFTSETSSLTVYRGNVGIGSTLPESRLTIQDDPKDDGHCERFPPSNMEDFEHFFEGHGMYTVHSSINNNTGYHPYFAFDANGRNGVWYTGEGKYNGGNGEYSGNVRLGTHTPLGEWISLVLPHPVYFHKAEIVRQANASHLIVRGKFYGRNGYDGEWEEIGEITSGAAVDLRPKVVPLVRSNAYNQVAFIATQRYPNSSTDGVSLQGLTYYGTRAARASTIDNGEMKLSHSVTVPRIGPALSPYRVPRPARLIKEINTSLSIHEDVIIGTNPVSTHTYANNSRYWQHDKAIKFDGSDDYVSLGNLITGANPHHSVSMWIYIDDNRANDLQTLFQAGGNYTGTGGSISWLYLYRPEGYIKHDFAYNAVEWRYTFELHKWYHIVLSYDGLGRAWGVNRSAVGATPDNRQLWINGVRQKAFSHSGTYISNSISIPNSTTYLGMIYANSSVIHEFSGLMSNIRFWDCGLADEDAWSLYKLGRVEAVHHLQVPNTTMVIGNHVRDPNVHLDVAGHIKAGSQEIHTFTGQHRCFPSEPVEQGLIVSADKNQFVKMNKGLATGSEAITIDESLPIVSLSKTANDKKCFGVVSSLEKSNTVTRREVTNGIVSEQKKELGDNRAIVNSVGEGAIWVCDAGGPLESGDYITTSAIKGYGQKQSDDVLHSYTVAKITMDCDFTATPVPVQAIKKVETLVDVTEDTWSNLSDYNRHSVTELKYVNSLGDALTTAEYVALPASQQGDYTQQNVTTRYRIQRGANLLDARGNLQWEDTDQMEAPYKMRYLDVSGTETDQANCVHRAAFVGCTYHCG